MKNCIIGTAGHVDHGKTSLVRALTGKETDTLKEEKERKLSIKAGYCFYKTKKGERISLIDFPGHEKFIKQMLIGIKETNLILLVIAANEGIMKQTQEHLEILFLLKKEIICVISKIDLVKKQCLIKLKENIKRLFSLKNKNTPVLVVDTIKGEGITKLKEVIEKKISSFPKISTEKAKEKKTRIAIDRVFSKKGWGTIITGSILSGNIKKNDILKLIPSGKKVKIRNIEKNEEKKETAFFGERVAINLKGVKKKEIKKEQFLTKNCDIISSKNIKIILTLIKPKKIKKKEKVRIYWGKKEFISRLIPIKTNKQTSNPLCRLITKEKISCLEGDVLIIRSLSPSRNIGTAKILSFSSSLSEKNNKNKRKQNKTNSFIFKETIQAYIISFFKKNKNKVVSFKEISYNINKEKKEAAKYIKKLIKEKLIKEINKDRFLLSKIIEINKQKIIKYIKKNKYIEIKEAKRILFFSRNNTVLFLEYLDEKKITKRKENKRILTKRKE